MLLKVVKEKMSCLKYGLKIKLSAIGISILNINEFSIVSRIKRSSITLIRFLKTHSKI